MNPLPVLPYMLQPERLKMLNDHLVDTTGCFAFLKTDQVLFSTAPQSWQDAYTIFSVGLYAVYHDYGCKFLRSLLLSDELCPDTLPTPKRHCIHIDSLNHDIRTNLAHGLMLSSQRAKLQRNLAHYYLESGSYSENPAGWPDYINHLEEKHWKQITERLVNDSNSLYCFLWQWGDEWAKQSEQLPGLREKFVSYQNYFARSFDDRIYRPLLLSYNVKFSAVSQYTSQNSPYIKRWRQKLVQAYRDGKTRPEELCHDLDQLIRQEVEPPQDSSIDIAAKFGFV